MFMNLKLQHLEVYFALRHLRNEQNANVTGVYGDGLQLSNGFQKSG